MNAVVLHHPASSQFRSQPRVHTQMRKLAMDCLWVSFSPDQESRLQNFTPELVQEFRQVIETLQHSRRAEDTPLHYAVLQSTHPDYFSTGGDLSFFRECIRQGDTARLRVYSMRCLELLLSWTGKLKDNTTSIALVQGRALGGGFETALSMDYLIAEEQSTFGFPEIMFGLFPCTGAMGLLSARIGARQAEKMMTNKKVYTAAEVYDMGLIDEICARGEGEVAVERFVKNHASRLKARLKVQQSRSRYTAIDQDDAVRVVDDWVETAMQLTADELRTLDMLIMMQAREAEKTTHVAAA